MQVFETLDAAVAAAAAAAAAADFPFPFPFLSNGVDPLSYMALIRPCKGLYKAYEDLTGPHGSLPK